MFHLINRLTWFVSILLGFFLVGIFAPYYYYYHSSFFFTNILGVLLGMIIKGVLFSEKYIKTALRGTIQTKEIKVPERSVAEESIHKQEPVKIKEEPKHEPDSLLEKLDSENNFKKGVLSQDSIEQNNTIYKQEENIRAKETIQIVEEKVLEENKVLTAIQAFFKENLLAKLGSLLVFLSVLFLIGLVWNILPSILKLLLGFTIGFSVYFSGIVLEKKGIQESKILLGTGILINFLVILGGKYILEGGLGGSAFLSSSVTFLLLILNTIFGVATGLYYKSNTILFLSFIAAYINPFLLGESGRNPYTLIGYSLIVSFGALYLSLKKKNIYLLIGAFILGNILILVAPFGTEIGWIAKIVSATFLSFSSLFILQKIDNRFTPYVLFASYIFIALHILISGTMIQNIAVYLLSLGTLFAGLFYNTIIAKKQKSELVFLSLLVPLLIFLMMMLNESMLFFGMSIGIIFIVYIVIFQLLRNNFSKNIAYGILSSLGIFVLIANIFFTGNLGQQTDTPLLSYIILSIISFLGIFYSYFLARKDENAIFYLLGTIGGIFLLAPLIDTGFIEIINTGSIKFGGQISENKWIQNIAIGSIILFGFLHTLFPVFHTKLLKKEGNFRYMSIGLIFGMLFITIELYLYGKIYFPGVALGMSFLALAIYYFTLGGVYISRIGMKEIQKFSSLNNTVYTYLAAALSLFSLSIAVIFRQTPEIVATIWLLESTILFFLYSKTKETLIHHGAFALFIIGGLKCIQTLSLPINNDMSNIFVILIVFTTLVLNLHFVYKIKNTLSESIHDIIHIPIVLILLSLVFQIFQGYRDEIGIITVLLTLGAFGYFYYKEKALRLKWFFLVVIGIIGLLQISNFQLEKSVQIKDVYHYIITIIITAFAVYIQKFETKKSIKNLSTLGIGIYLLIMLSLYIMDIFNNTFILTLFGGIIASVLFSTGMNRNKAKLRTLGLYLGTLVIGKVFLYDIWFGIDDAIARVIALMILGVILIVLGIRFSKKYGDNLAKEFDLSNLIEFDIPMITTNDSTGQEENHQQTTDTKEKDTKEDMYGNESYRKEVTEKIKKTDINDIEYAKFYIDGKMKFKTRSKNLLKIIKYGIENYKKSEFEPKELERYYEYIVNNFVSELPKRDYNTVQNTFKDFTETGGKVVFQNKKS